jgi:U3 small nucleolar RNA-associated protein 3
LNEDQAREEEEEARRLQKKKLQKMSAADFEFDESEWRANSASNTGEVKATGVVTEVLKDVEMTANMSPAEKMNILRMRYPEFDYLADEFVTLQPRLQDLVTEVEAEGPAKKVGATKSTTVIKCRALAAYLSSLAMYFAILSSPASDSGLPQLIDPAEIHDHPVMDSKLPIQTSMHY